jgi:hypothetical protein
LVVALKPGDGGYNIVMLPSVYRTRRALIALILAEVMRAGPPPPELLARWPSLETSSTGLGSMLTFHPNGVVDFSAGVVVEGPYRIEGDELIVPPSSVNGPEQRLKLGFVGLDQLRLAEIALKRQGAAPDASHPILGEWVGKSEMNGRQLEVRYLFYQRAIDPAHDQAAIRVRRLDVAFGI